MNTLRTWACVFAVCGAGLIAGCASNDVEKPMTNQGEAMHFGNLDRTGDRLLTPDELPVDNELFVNFPLYDLNRDGAISEYEFGEYVANLPD
jgi:hypothetical protein